MCINAANMGKIVCVEIQGRKRFLALLYVMNEPSNYAKMYGWLKVWVLCACLTCVCKPLWQVINVFPKMSVDVFRNTTVDVF